MADIEHTSRQGDEIVSDRVLTVPNVISFVRLLMAPIAFAVLLKGFDLAAALLFGISAATDFVDGQIARRTNSVSRVGQLLDPAVDRILMICGVLGLLLVGRLPLWIVVVVLVRDVFLLAGGSYLLRNYGIRVPVIYPGKVGTTFLFFGMFGLMLNMPQLAGLGLCDFGWLPGFNYDPCSWGIWLVYIGLLIALFTTAYYVRTALNELHEAKEIGA